MEVTAAVESDLSEIAKRDPALAKSGLAASALALARSMDRIETSATAKSMCARILLDTLDRLRELAPAEQESDDLDDLATRRAARLAGGAAAAN